MMNGKVISVVKGAVAVGSALAVAFVCGCAQPVVDIKNQPPQTLDDGRQLVWYDEFDGNALDASKWGFQTGLHDTYGDSVGPQNWGNQELQTYTDGDNLDILDGQLNITARREDRDGMQFTSSRIATRDCYSFTYGYIEARIKAPAVRGMWPAFWLLPQPDDTSSSDNVYDGWPANGEIDIMEAKGRLEKVVDCTIHFGSDLAHYDYEGNSTTLDSVISEWHTYALDWTEQRLVWKIDGAEVLRVESSHWWTSASESPSAPFDRPFYILINLAVGGRYDGNVKPYPDFTSATMSVDYVRVYQ